MLSLKTDVNVPTVSKRQKKTMRKETYFLLAFWKPLKKNRDPNPFDREVWPAGDSFGAADAEPEEDFMALREILFADLGTGNS